MNTIVETAHQSMIAWFNKHEETSKIYAQEVEKITKELVIISPNGEVLIHAPLQSELRNFLRPLYTGMDYESFFIIGPGNINLASARDSNVGKLNLLNEQEGFLQRIWSGETLVSLPVLTDVPLPDKSGKVQERRASMFVSTPLKDQSGAIIALLTLRIDPNKDFTQLFDRAHLGSSGKTYCVDSRGRMITNSRFHNQLVETGLINQNESEILNLTLSDPGVNLVHGEKRHSSPAKEPLTRMAESLTAGESGSDLEGYRDYRGVPVIGTWIWNNKYELGVATEVDVSQAFGTLNRLIAVTMLLMSLSVGMIFGISILFSRWRKQLSESEERFRNLYETSIIGLYRTTPDGQFRMANPTLVNMLGYGSFHELAQIEQESSYVDSGQRADFKKILEEHGEVVNFEIERYCKNGAIILVSESVKRGKDNAGKIVYDGTVEDITSRKRAEEELRLQSEVIANMNEAVYLIRAKDGTIVYTNTAFETMFGYNHNEMLGSHVSIVNAPTQNDPNETAKEIINLVEKEGSWKGEIHNIRKDGTIFWSYATVSKFDHSKFGKVFVSIHKDISLHKHAEEKYKHILDTALDGFWTTDMSGRLLEVNHSYCQMSGYTRDELLQMNVRTLEAAEDPDDTRKHIEKVIASGSDRFTSKHLRKDGTTFDVEVGAQYITSKENPIFVAFIKDISERIRSGKKLIDSENTLRRAQSVAKVGSWRLDVHQNVLEWSSETYSIFSIPDDVSMTFETFLACVHPDDQEYVNKSWNAALKGAPYNIEHRIRVNGNIKWVQERAELEIDTEGMLLRGIGTVQDITERKYAEEKLNSALQEKEILLKEIHHRVKNNLQIVSGLLYLQSQQLTDEKTIGMFAESLNRIKAMGLLHEFLYQSEDVKNIDFKSYLHELISVLKASYLEKNAKIAIELSIKGSIEFEKALYCGLIINELVSNALKYAFKGSQDGKVAIQFEKQNNEYCLTISDNGSGIPVIDTVLRGKTLGLKIVGTLTQQLEGTINYTTDRGTTVVIIFPMYCSWWLHYH